MDMTPQFTVFFAMVMATLVEIPLLFGLLHLLGVRKYAGASLSEAAMWGAGLMVALFYGGWKLAPLLDNPTLLWFVAAPVALLAGVVFMCAFALPMGRAIAGGLIFFVLHCWIVPLLPQAEEVWPQVLIEKSADTQARPVYQFDTTPPIHNQWYAQLKAWESTRLMWAPFLEQLDKRFTDESLPVRVNELLMTAANAGDIPRMEVAMDGNSLKSRKSAGFRQFVGELGGLALGTGIVEELSLDRFAEDISSGAPKGSFQFAVRGYRYLPLPQGEEGMKGLSRDAAKLGIGLVDEWMRVNPQERRGNEWARLRAARIVSSGRLPVILIKPLSYPTLPHEGGGYFLKAFSVRLVLTAGYGEIVRAVREFEASAMVCRVDRIHLRRSVAQPGNFDCEFDVLWPQWGTREIEADVARLLGRPLPQPVYGESEYDEEVEQLLRMMQESQGYAPMSYP